MTRSDWAIAVVCAALGAYTALFIGRWLVDHSYPGQVRFEVSP